MKRSFIREILESIDSDTISFAGGLPDEGLFPTSELANASAKVFANSKNMQYTISNGITPLREKIAQMYQKDGIATNSDNILITTGSQQALYIIAKYFYRHSITIESPSYLGATKVFGANSLSMDSVRLLDDGIDLNDFEKSYKKSRLAYLIPDFQNPKASQYSEYKRVEIAKIAQKYSGYIIEDAPYSELFFDKKIDSIAKSIPDNTLHLGSFSKTLAPSFRLGWIRANSDLIAKLLPIKETIDLHTCGITQYIVDEYLATPHYNEHLNILRGAYKDKMEVFCDGLDEILPSFEYTRPSGGMFVYGRLCGVDTYKLVQKALANGVVYVPASEFYIDRSFSDEIRFNFTHSTKEQIIEGLERLREVLR
jgi:2-aminoadipate transaminase